MSTTSFIEAKVSLADQLRTVEQLIASWRTRHCTGEEMAGLRATAESLRRLQKLRATVVDTEDPDPDVVCDLVLDCLGNPGPVPGVVNPDGD